jgi:hypothetical protein
MLIGISIVPSLSKIATLGDSCEWIKQEQNEVLHRMRVPSRRDLLLQAR